MPKLRETGKTKLKLPTKFDVKCFDDCDQRFAKIKRLRRTLHKLQQEVGADTIVKQMLCRRVLFTDLQLERMEVELAETGEVDASKYAHLFNKLITALSRLNPEVVVEQPWAEPKLLTYSK